MDAPTNKLWLPADLLVFAGQGPESRGIALMTCEPWQLLKGQWFSHIGICAKGPAGNVLLFESTTLCDLPCEITRRKTKGVQAHKPADRLAAYQGKAWRVRLTEPLTPGESGILSTFVVSKIGEPYDWGAVMCVTWRLRLATWFVPRSDTYFCSDLVMAGLKEVRRVDQDLNPRSYSPGRTVRDLAYWGTSKEPERVK